MENNQGRFLVDVKVKTIKECRERASRGLESSIRPVKYDLGLWQEVWLYSM